jgi:hypothetical protein
MTTASHLRAYYTHNNTMAYAGCAPQPQRLVTGQDFIVAALECPAYGILQVVRNDIPRYTTLHMTVKHSKC